MYHYRYWSTVHTTAAGFVCVRLRQSGCIIRVSVPGEKPSAAAGTAANKERKSRSACLRVKSSFSFFPSQLADLADGCLHNDRSHVGRWNWFTASVHTSFTVWVHPPPLQKNVNPTQKRTLRPRGSGRDILHLAAVKGREVGVHAERLFALQLIRLALPHSAGHHGKECGSSTVTALFCFVVSFALCLFGRCGLAAPFMTYLP